MVPSPPSAGLTFLPACRGAPSTSFSRQSLSSCCLSGLVLCAGTQQEALPMRQATGISENMPSWGTEWLTVVSGRQGEGIIAVGPGDHLSREI